MNIIKRLFGNTILYMIAKKYKQKWDAKHNRNYKKVLKNELKYYNGYYTDDSYERLVFQVRMKMHAIEKLIVTNKLSLNAAKSSADFLFDKLSELIEKYNERKDSVSLVNDCVAIIKSIINECKDSDIEEKLNNICERYDLDINIAPICIKEASGNSRDTYFQYNDFDSFVRSRHSIREFDDKCIDTKIIEKIISLASLCPSACNRQSWRVYYTKDYKKIYDLRPDPVVTKNIKNYFIVTIDKSIYSYNEVLWPWINGGIFLESLVLAIQSQGLGSCIFGCYKYAKNTIEIKEIASIPENEEILAFIGFGFLPERYKYIETHRKPVDEILRMY